MTPGRLILIVAVLALTFFAINAALMRRNRDAGVSPPQKGFTAWVGSLAAGSQAVPVKDLALIVEGNAQELGEKETIRLSALANSAVLMIRENSDKKVRMLTLRAPENTPKIWHITFEQNPPDPEDEGAVRSLKGAQTLFGPGGQWPKSGERIIPIGQKGGKVTIKRTLPGNSALILFLRKA